MTQLTVVPRKYLVTRLDPNHMDATLWGVTIEWRDTDLWAVCHMGKCYTVTREWVREPSPSNREQSFLDATRFNFGKAAFFAELAVDSLVINGMTSRDMAAARHD